MKGPRLGRLVRAGALTGGLLAVVAAALSSCRPGAPDRAADRPQAVVLFVGDGFGISHLTLSRLVLRNPEGRLKMESLPVFGLVSTYPAVGTVTDSAAAGTALATGVKTANHVLGLDQEGNRLRSLADRARREGWSVGLVTTTRVTHATPAAFYAHTPNRYDEEEIALQLLEAPVDLVLGGGSYSFLPVSEGGSRRDGRNLIEEARKRGWKVSLRGEPLENPEGARWLGLLASSHLGFRIDENRRPKPARDPSLADLTRIAFVDLEARGRPFFVMIEGGRIDHAGHAFDAASIVHETADFDEAIEVAKEFQRRHPGTLLLVTSDHATGGLAINDFSRPEDLRRRTASVSWLVDQIRNAGAGIELVHQHTGYRDLRPEELEAVRHAADGYEAARRLGTALSLRDGFTWLPRVDPDGTQGHTGEDVPLFADGPGAYRFGGALDHTDIPKRLCDLLQWSHPCP